MDNTTGKAFNFKLFKRLLKHTSPYKITFYGVALAAILLSVFAVFSPILMREIVDLALGNKDAELLLTLILLMVAVIIAEVICQLFFIFYANWMGESVVRDIRISLFEHMMSFKMKYYDTSSVGLLVTRAVSDIQRIGEIFSQGFFMIVADLLKMVVVAGVMLFYNWKLSLIVFAVLPILLYATRLFQQAMKVAFIDVRAQVSNLNSFCSGAYYRNENCSVIYKRKN